MHYPGDGRTGGDGAERASQARLGDVAAPPLTLSNFIAGQKKAPMGSLGAAACFSFAL